MGALAIIDIRQHDGHVRRVEVTRWPVRIGRALDNDIVLDDPHVAPHHLTIGMRPEGLGFDVGETVNGVHVDRVQYSRDASGAWPARAALRLGKTTLHARTTLEPLPAETPFARQRNGTASLLLLLVLVFGATALDTWLSLDRDEPWWRMLLPPFLTLALLLGLWVGGWSLVSKLFTKHLEGRRHLRIALTGLMLVFIGAEALSLTAFAFNLPALDRYSALFGFGALAALAYAHLRAVSPARLGLHTLSIGIPTLALASAYTLGQYTSSGNPAGQHFMTALYPPIWRIAEAKPLARFMAESAALQTELDALARDPAEEDREYPK